LRFVESVERQRGGFDVENERGHECKRTGQPFCNVCRRTVPEVLAGPVSGSPNLIEVLENEINAAHQRGARNRHD
jgi:hypothetical protein